MPTSTKPSGNSISKAAKFGNLAYELHPDIDWLIQQPDPQLEKDYGKGFIVTGLHEEKKAVYFILEEDPRKENWIHMIASQVKGEE